MAKRLTKAMLREHEFFLLYRNAYAAGVEYIETADSNQFNPTQLWDGRAYEGDLPLDLSIRLAKGKPTDTLGNALSWMIVSARCAKAIRAFTEGTVQHLPLRTSLPNGQIEEIRYVVLNPLGTLDAIYAPGKNKSKVSLVDLVIKSQKVPHGRHLFRLMQKPTTMVASSKLVECLFEKKFEGFAASPLSTR